MKEQCLVDLRDNVVAYRPDLAKAFGSINAALFFCQLLYWEGKGSNPEMVYKTMKEMYDETALTRREQDTARSVLKEIGLIEEVKKGMPCRIFYKIQYQKYREVMSIYYENRDIEIEKNTVEAPCMAENANQECSNQPTMSGGTSQNITKNTQRLPHDIKVLPPDSLMLLNKWNASSIIVHCKIPKRGPSVLKNALKTYGFDNISNAIDLYVEILKDDRYWWTYRCSLWDFLEKHIEKFLPCSLPKITFLKNNIKSVSPNKSVNELYGVR